MITENLYWLDQIQSSEEIFVGNKAFILSQLLKQGYPVIPSFVISATVTQEFIWKNQDFNLFLNLNIKDYQALQKTANYARQQIIEKKFSQKLLSDIITEAKKLQSSSLRLCPSIYVNDLTKLPGEELLENQTCWCQPEALAVAIKNMWAELFRARNIFYWLNSGINLNQINLAIIVQPLVDAIVAGNVEIEPKYLHIRANWGLGDSLLKGEISPDYYQINRVTKNLENKQLGTKILAYKRKLNLPSVEITENCLEFYLLGKEQQEQYVLTDQSWLKLLTITKEILAGYIEWILVKNNSLNQFYFTKYQSSSQQKYPVVKQQKLPMIDWQLLLQGLAASPGEITGLAEVLLDFNPHLQEIPEDKILVTKTINPDWLPLLSVSKGIITEQGGITSHAAIMARELGIPAIVGVTNATQLIKTGQTLLIKGDTGDIYDSQITKIIDSEKKPSSLSVTTKSTMINDYPLGTKLLVNLSQSNLIKTAATLPVDGVGLIRSELLLLELISFDHLEVWLKGSKKIKLIDNLTNLITQFATAFKPRPIFYRSSDCYSSQLSSFSSLQQRGTYNYLLDSTLFEVELTALLKIQEAGYSNVNLILPFVRTLEEFIFCRDRIKEIGLTKNPAFQLWIMVEVPSVIFLLPEYIKAGVQGIAIGTNDLTQLLLGIDREKTLFDERLNPLHPSMLIVLKQLINTARNANIPCCICGQAPVLYPDLIDYLVQWGITSISVETNAVTNIRNIIAKAEHKLLLEAARLKLNYQRN